MKVAVLLLRSLKHETGCETKTVTRTPSSGISNPHFHKRFQLGHPSWKMWQKCLMCKNQPGVIWLFSLNPIYNLLAVQRDVARAIALRWTFSLRSCSSVKFCRFAPVAPLNFVVSLLWLRSASSLPDRLLNPQITPFRNFVLLWTSVGFRK